MERSIRSNLIPGRAMTCAVTVVDVPRCPKPRHDRLVVAAKVINFDKARAEATSQRQFALGEGVARSTLQGWVTRRERIEAKPSVVAFCESPDGVEFIHGIYAAALYTFTKDGPDGIRRMQAFVKASPLSPFVASSFGAIQKSSKIMDGNILTYDAEQTAIMGKVMQPKKVSVAEDESFFPRTCLVAIEPVSDYILLEEYADNRTAATWNAALKKCLDGLPVIVIQTVSDQARGLICHAMTGLGAHHSPDLFHVQRELGKAFGPLFRSLLRRGEAAIAETTKTIDLEIKACDEYVSQIENRGPGRPPDFEGRIEAAKAALAAAQENLAAIKKQQEETYAEIRGIGLDHHPFDLKTGEARQAEDVKKDVDRRFETLEATADDVDMSEQLRKYIKKAGRVTPDLIATIAFFWGVVRQTIEEQKLSQPMEQFLLGTLIPIAYLSLVLGKLKDRAMKDIVRATIAKLQQAVDATGSPIGALDAEARAAMFALAQQCAEFFQRSSSCVEGRNGVLSLHHHAGRNLPSRRLRVLKTIHNFGIKRADGTTAAFRLSGYRHPDLFRWILKRQPLPARPARTVAKAS